MPTVAFAFDKFRDTATAQELVDVGRVAARSAGWRAAGQPLADGGEGSLDVLGGANKFTVVTGPLGDPVEAGWRMDRRSAFIEMAAASGLAVAGGAEENDPLAADTLGTGELISAAIELGARTVRVLLGGSATTDGGFGAIRALPPRARLKGIDLTVAVDVDTRFCDAARVFGPQKGASPAQVELLTRRLERLAQIYQEEYGVDVSDLRGAGAAGGLAGGLVAMGATIERGFDVLAEHIGLDMIFADADLVVTGEGRLDAESFNGKVVGGVATWAADAGVPVLAVVGTMDEGLTLPEGLDVVSLEAEFGLEAAQTRTLQLVGEVVAERLTN